MKKNEPKISGSLKKHYIIAFWASMAVSLGLLIGGFLCPPQGEIHGSTLEGAGIIFLWPSLAFAAKALEENNKIKISHGNTQIVIGEDTDKFIDTPIEEMHEEIE